MTLTAKDDQSPAGAVITRYTTGVVPGPVSVLSPIYSDAAKPVLANGEKISYSSVDEAGNSEAIKTSRAVIIGPATQGYTHEIAGTTGSSPVAVAVGDVTGDGRPDLVTANAIGTVSVIARRSDGTGWATSTIAGPTGTSPHAVAVGDVTGDGRPDLITVGDSSDDVSVIARKSDGSGWEASTIAGTTGSRPLSVAVEDVTGDGRPDLITANYSSNDVSVIARKSDGSGWEASTIAGTTGGRPRSVAVADVTGDGRPDLITANADDNTVSVIARNSTDTGWESPAVAGTTGTNPYAVAVVDVTGDGRPDLITANAFSNNVSVIARNSTGWEASTIAGPTGNSPRSVTVADVTGDGRPDLITVNTNSDDVSVLTARPDATAPVTTDDVPTSYRASPVTVTLTAVDGTDGSGVKDTYYTAGVSPANPTTASAKYDPSAKPTLANGEKISYFSVDWDGNTEAVKTSTAAKVDQTKPTTTDDVPGTWDDTPVPVTLTAADTESGVADTYYTTGTSPETPTTASAKYDSTDKPTLANGEKISYFSVDKVGNTEAVKTSAAAKVVQTPPTTIDDVPATYRTSPVMVTLTATDPGTGGSGVKDTYYTTGTSPESPTTASATYDPDDKPILANGEKISYFSVDKVGNAKVVKTSRAVIIAPATQRYAGGSAGYAGSDSAPRSVAVADVTGDGRPDLITANSGRNNVSVIVRSNDGTGWASSFQDGATVVGTTGTRPVSVAAADVTGDGRPDLITANAVSNDVSVIARNSAGTGWEPSTIAGSTGSYPTSVAVADVTGDGQPDLIVANLYGHNVSVIARDSAGTGWESSVIAGTTGIGPLSLAVADVTGDGRLDLITANVTDNDVSVIARNSTGTGWEPSATAGTTGQAPNSVAVADVTGDGRPDLITANTASNDVSVIARNSAGTGWEPSTIAGRTRDAPRSVAVEDLTGDGRPDLITANEYDNSVSVIERSADGTGWKTSTVAGYTTSGNPRGSAPVSVAAADVTGDGRPDLITANEISNDVTVLTARFDGTAPITTDDVPATYSTAPIRVRLTAVDESGGSGVRATYYTTGTSPASPTTSSARYELDHRPTLAHGERISYFSIDDAGNREAVKTSAPAKVDGDAPTTADDVDGVWHDAPVTVTLTATDTRSGVAETHYTVGASPATPTASSPTYDPARKPILANGEKIAYFSVDVAGNAEVVRTSAAAKVDAGVPDTVIATRPAPLGSDARPSITFSSLSIDATFECALDGGAFVACTSPFRPATALTDGPHRFDVRATSRAGLVDPTPASATFVVDTNLPDAPQLLAGPPAASSETTASIAFAIEPGATATCSVDRGPFTACGSPLVLTGLAVGDHEVRVTQTDGAGNAGPTLRVTFAVTAKPPPSEPPSTEPTATRVSLATRSTPARAPTALIRRTTLDCTADRGALRSCTVEARSVKALKTTAGKRLPAGTVLARGASAGGAAPTLAVGVQLTAAARSVAERYPLGIDAQVTTTATTAAGTTLNASSRLAVLGNPAVVLPVRSATSTKLSAASKRALAQLARTVGEATSVRCAAYTDNSRSALAARKLTTGQAQAACRYLVQRGLKATSPVKGYGSKRPRASNATAKGRAKNRRLEITVAF